MPTKTKPPVPRPKAPAPPLTRDGQLFAVVDSFQAEVHRLEQAELHQPDEDYCEGFDVFILGLTETGGTSMRPAEYELFHEAERLAAYCVELVPLQCDYRDTITPTTIFRQLWRAVVQARQRMANPPKPRTVQLESIELLTQQKVSDEQIARIHGLFIDEDKKVPDGREVRDIRAENGERYRASPTITHPLAAQRIPNRPSVAALERLRDLVLARVPDEEANK